MPRLFSINKIENISAIIHHCAKSVELSDCVRREPRSRERKWRPMESLLKSAA